MVVLVRVAADPLALLVLLIFVIHEFLVCLRRALPVDDDLPALQPFHPVLHAVRTFDCFLRLDAQAAVVRDGFRLGAVAGGDQIVIAPVMNPAGGLLVGHFVADMLVHQIDGLAGPVIVKPDKGIGIRKPAPVHALVDPVEALHLLVGDGPQLQILKDAAAGADGDAQVLMLISALVPFPQRFGLLDEGFAQPLRMVQVEIGALVLIPVRPGFGGILVRPVITGAGRVIGFKIPEVLAAAHGRLQDAVDLGTPGELVLLLKVRNGDVSEFRFDRFDLHRVIRAAEHDLLPGGLEDQFERGLPGLPILRDAQRLDAPEVLGVYGIAQGVRHFSQDQGVGIRMLHQQADHRQARPGGFRAAAPAAGLKVGVPVLEGIDRDSAEGRVDVLQIIGTGQDQGPLLGAGLFLAELVDGGLNPLLPFFDGRDVTLGRGTIDRRGNHRVVLLFGIVDAELLKLRLHLLIGDLGVGDQRGQVPHPAADLLRLRGLRLPALPIFTCDLAGDFLPE